MTRRSALALVAAAAAIPRLVVLVADRDEIVLPYTRGEKSDDFARTFVSSGTFGFIPDVPSAYTQPLLSFFLIPLYELFGRSWAVVGLAQIVLSVVTALLVFAIGAAWIGQGAGVAAALLTTLHPYAVWHDVHLNRENLDAALAVVVVALALALFRRRTLALALALGGALGVAILGNVRLAALPLLLAALLVWRSGVSRRTLALGGVVVAAAAVVVAPWVVRNHVVMGCAALTTDARALWEANNERTLGVLRNGGWIDNVPIPRGDPPSPQDASRAYYRRGVRLEVDECAHMRLYRRRTLDFWQEHPGEKARLAGQALIMLWSPSVSPTDLRGVAKTWLNRLRSSVEPLYVVPLYALGVGGVLLVGSTLRMLAVALLAYQTVVAAVFVGATRYRVPWDFLIALLAGAALVRLLAVARRSRVRADAQAPA